MKPGNQNSFNSLKELNINGKNYSIYSLKEAEKNGLEGINKLPKSIKVLLENLVFPPKSESRRQCGFMNPVDEVLEKGKSTAQLRSESFLFTFWPPKFRH